MVDILFGIIGDGGGLAHRGDVPVPVDPWGWLTKTQLDLAFVRATSIVEQQFADDPKAQLEGLKFLLEFRDLLEGDESNDDETLAKAPANGTTVKSVPKIGATARN